MSEGSKLLPILLMYKLFLEVKNLSDLNITLCGTLLGVSWEETCEWG